MIPETLPGPAICEFCRLIPDAPHPQRADRSANGALPVDG
jgi:hypothetical protein